MSSTLPSFWLAEGQSSQRDMIISLQQLKKNSKNPFQIIASHRHHRPEITELADKHFQEPNENRVNFVLSHAQQSNVKVLLTGRNSIDYEQQRPLFEQANIRLLTGATDCQTLELIENKEKFIYHCQQHHIPVADGWVFNNSNELNSLLKQYSHLPLCVKPVIGIFAQGFWRLDTGKAQNQWDSFEHLYFTDNKKIHLNQFLSAYQHSELVQNRPIPMLLMPYLAGQEYSIDVVCERGEVLLAITRYKQGSVQHIGYDPDVMAVVKPLIQSVGCDGIVSVQTKGDDTGQQKVLEINSRPSGGIGYTVHCGVDLTQLAFAYWAGWLIKDELMSYQAKVQPCTVRPLTTSVKIDK